MLWRAGKFRIRLMFSPVDEIKNKLDVVEVVSGYIKLQKAGRNLKANCPFHNEKTPSFFVSPERQMWHCFGCGAGGSIFDFVMQIEGVEFADALRTLAQRAGVVLKRQDPQLRTERQRLYEICELAAKFFEKQLAATKQGEKITEYLLGRGIKKETIAGWRIGYAPDDWHALVNFLEGRGYKTGEIERAGLVVKKESGTRNRELGTRHYDRFRNRIIFPICDLNGQIVGFSGRILPDDKQESAKYINTPQTPLYDKSRLLYGLDRAKMEIRKNDACIVVEGYTDVLMSHQMDFSAKGGSLPATGGKNTVATCGTALTEDQLKIIKRYSENLILAFDMDIAGDTATKRGIDLAIEEGLNVRIILPEARPQGAKQDPADIIKDSPERWQKIVNGAQGAVEYYFANAFSKYNPKEIGGKKEIAKIILPVLKKIPDKTEQGDWIQKLAHRLRVQEKFLIEAINKIKNEKQTPKIKENFSSPNKPKTRILALEEEFLALLFHFFEAGAQTPIPDFFFNSETAVLFSEPDLREIFLSLQTYVQNEKEIEKIDLKKWQKKLSPALSLRLGRLMLRIETRDVDKCNLAADPFDCCLKELKKEKIRQKLNELQYEIKISEGEKDKEKLKKFLGEFKALSESLLNI